MQAAKMHQQEKDGDIARCRGCAGCGQMIAARLVADTLGPDTIIANATGCSSIYGGNLPTTPYSTDECGRGPAWANSLFEDNAEFGLGMRLSVDKHQEFGLELMHRLGAKLGDELVAGIATASQEQTQGIEQVNSAVAQMDRVVQQSAARAEEGAALAQELSAQSTSLQRAVEELAHTVGGQSATARKASAAPSVTQCIDTNTRCLLDCPQADPDAAARAWVNLIRHNAQVPGLVQPENAYAFMRRLQIELGREPMAEEIAVEMNMDVDKIYNIEKIDQATVSLESPVEIGRAHV